MPDLSIIIVNWNTRELLATCLSSIADEGENGAIGRVLRFETIVVDNASTDGSAVMVRERFPWIALIENAENAGFARANNQALALCQGRFALLLNSDTVVRPGSPAALATYMEQHPEVGFLGCQLLNADLTLQGSYADFPDLLSAMLGKDRRRHIARCHDGSAVEVDAISGACMLVRREVLDRIGGMDEAYHLYVEEVDWCYRGRQAGWKVCYLPDVKIVHLLGQSRKRRPWFSYLNLHRSRLLFFAKHYGRRRAQMLRFGYMFMAACKTGVHALGFLLHRDRAKSEKVSQNWRLLRWLAREQDIIT